MDLEELIDFLTRVLPFSDRFYSVFSCAGTYCSFIITVVLGLFAILTFRHWRVWKGIITNLYIDLIKYNYFKGESRELKRITEAGLTDIHREFNNYNPNNNTKVRPWAENGFVIKGECEKKPEDEDSPIRDWKGKAFEYPNGDWFIEMVRAEVYPMGYSNKDEWKIAISLIDPTRDVSPDYRLHGPGQITYEISRHWSEGLQVILSIFGGHPRKVRSAKLSESSWNKVKIVLKDERLRLFIEDELLGDFDSSMKKEIIGFNPTAIWFVCWTDEKGWVEAGFKNVVTYWRKG